MVDEVQTEKKPIELVVQGNNEDISKTDIKQYEPTDNRSKYSQELKLKVIKMVSQGIKYDDILKETGIKHRSTISRFINEGKPVLKKRKDRFIRILDRIGVNDVKLAGKLLELLDANRLVISGKNEGTTPDNPIQLETAKYINQLKGRGIATQGRQMGIRGENIEVVIKDY